MLLKTICIILVINISATLCNDSIRTPDLHSIGSQLAELKALHDNCNPHHIRTHARNCAEATINSHSNGIHEIQIPNYIEQPFKVACDAKTQGGGWTIILSRLDGSVNFYRNWNSYKRGFGDLDGEFFLGLDKIHALTAEFSQELLIILEDFSGNEKQEWYDKFAIGDENEDYALQTLGKASGSAGDCLTANHGLKFTTFDRDNDLWDNGNCAESQKSAWWYHSCSKSNLAGKYEGKDLSGVYWHLFQQFHSLKKAIMMIRPRK